MDGLRLHKINNLHDIKTHLHLLCAYGNNGKKSERFGKLTENKTLITKANTKKLTLKVVWVLKQFLKSTNWSYN